MAKYRKLPVVIEAREAIIPEVVHTLEGDMRAEAGDMIITGVAGEQYPCRRSIFDATYEEVGPGEEENLIVTRRVVKGYVNPLCGRRLPTGQVVHPTMVKNDTTRVYVELPWSLGFMQDYAGYDLVVIPIHRLDGEFAYAKEIGEKKGRREKLRRERCLLCRARDWLRSLRTKGVEV